MPKIVRGRSAHRARLRSRARNQRLTAQRAKCGDHALLAIIDASKSGGGSLAFSEYFGGSGSDLATAIYLDSSGTAYIGGQTTSPNFPVTANAVQSSYTPCSGCEQYRGPAFVAVVNPTSKKKTLLYSTYLGGATVLSPTYLNAAQNPENLVEVDAVNGIAVDANGVIHAAGLTYASGFPITGDALEKVCKACATLGSDGFIARINPSASTGAEALEYSSFLGGAGPRFFGDYAAGVAMDSSGAVYLAGLTTSADFPVTPSAFQQNCAGCVAQSLNANVYPGSGAFVAKLNPMAAPDSQLIYATYLGGTSLAPEGASNAAATGIAVDATGEAYTVGVANAADFPTTTNAYSSSCSSLGSGCIFFAKLDSTGSNLLYSSFLGTGDSANIAVDPNANALIAGSTHGEIPVTPGAVQSNCKLCNIEVGVTSGYFSKVHPNASGAASLVYSTYLSGSGGSLRNGTLTGDAIYAIASDPNGNAILTGQATSLDFPTTPNAYQPQCTTAGECASPFVSVIDPTLSGPASLPYSTYLDGTMSNVVGTGYAAASDPNGDIYLGGNTQTTDFPVSPNSFQPACPSSIFGPGPCNAGFIVELNRNAAPVNQLIYGSYLGDVVTALGVDSNGRIFAAGHTDSPNFPVTPDAVQPNCLTCAARPKTQGRDGFFTVLNPAASGASQLVYSTYLGGSGYDGATGLAIGPLGLVAVAGYSSSTDFPTTANAFELRCPACGNNTASAEPFYDFTNSPGYLDMDAFVSVFQF